MKKASKKTPADISEKTSKRMPGKSAEESRADQPGGKGLQRLDRLLGQEGLGTRSELKKAIRSGRALVNGAVEKDPGRQISPEDEVCFDGRKVRRDRYVYYMLNKPAGVITATEDGQMRTVLDLLRESVSRKGLFPVGRLDRDTEGLLLITDDGQLAHRLLSPARHVDKTYYAVVTGTVTEEDVRLFAEGLRVDDGFTAMPAVLQIMKSGTCGNAPEKNSTPETEDSGQYTQTCVTIREGKFHQIKRMFAAVGKEVLYLKRLSMGTLKLDPSLEPGQFRELTEEEAAALREH